jgi:hypothetical protein
MATLGELVAQLPLELRSRYDFTDFWVPAGNALLSEIAQQMKLADNIKEVAVEVTNSSWIEKPSDCRIPVDCYVPDNIDTVYNIEQVDQKIRLKGDTFVKTQMSVSNVASLVATGATITVSYAGPINPFVADYFKGMLLVMSNGNKFYIDSSELGISTGGGNYTVVLTFLPVWSRIVVPL